MRKRIVPTHRNYRMIVFLIASLHLLAALPLATPGASPLFGGFAPSGKRRVTSAALVSPMKELFPGEGGRYTRVVIEDFKDFERIDTSNTTCGVDTRSGRVGISKGHYFPGGGMSLKLVPTGAYKNDNSCTQVCYSTNSGDASGKFVAAWYNGGHYRNNVISGVRFMRGNAELSAAIPRSPRGPGNCIPFGSGGRYGPHQGFVYKNMDPFSLQNGDQIWFDVARANDADVIYDIFLGHTKVNGGKQLDGDGYTQVAYAANGGRGSAKKNDWKLRFTVSGIAGGSGADKGYVQSVPLYQEWPTIGAARITWYEHKPKGTNIVYNLTADGEHWVTMENHTDHVFEHRGSHLMWNATLTSEDPGVIPYITKVVIEYDLISDPEPRAPVSDVWQGTATPLLEWNFTDPDEGDHQSDYLLEIFEDISMKDQVYNTSWVNSTEPEHRVESPLEDGEYYWRVRTKDAYHAPSNYSEIKKFKIDVTKPVGNITIENDVFSVNEELVSLSIQASDNGSGVADMRIINDRGSAREWEPYKEEKGIALSPDDGSKTVGVKFRDNAGIVSVVFNDSVYLDLKGPDDIGVTSPTHPDPERYYRPTSPVFRWEAPYEVTEIKGYNYLVDSSPNSEPYKDFSDPHGPEKKETSPAEFPNLKDGTWYFHISACDVYNQWSNTTHFRFNIDSTPPIITDTDQDVGWSSDKVAERSVIFEDVGGFGLDTDSVEYAVKRHGEEKFGTWSKTGLAIEVLERSIADNPGKVKATTQLELNGGDENAVKWRVSDLSGNGPVESEAQKIKIDLLPVEFSASVPDTDEVHEDTLVPCGITITDRGSGVDGSTVEYAVSGRGSEEEHFKRWNKVGNNRVEGSIDLQFMVEFDYGKENYIKWRASDAVGNGPAVSDPFRVWVNSPPVPQIALPEDEALFYQGEDFNLSAEGTEDNEGDVLSYWWVVKNRSTRRAVRTLSADRGVISLDVPGLYMVYLYVDDGHGANESERVDVRILKRTTPEEEEEDKEDREEESSERAGGSSGGRWWLLLVGVGVLLVILVLSLVMVRRKRKRVPDIPDKLPASGRYSGGYGADFYSPGQPYSPPSYGGTSVPASSVGAGGSSWGEAGVGGRQQLSAQGGLPGPSQQLPVSHQTGPGASAQPIQRLPPGPSPSQYQTFQPGGAPVQTGVRGASYPQAASQPSLPQAGSYLPGQGQQSAQTPRTPGPPQYSLPTFNTDEGRQNLNRPALPPAPEEEPGQAGTGYGTSPPVKGLDNVSSPDGEKKAAPDPFAGLAPGKNDPSDLPPSPPPSPPVGSPPGSHGQPSLQPVSSGTSQPGNVSPGKEEFPGPPGPAAAHENGRNSGVPPSPAPAFPRSTPDAPGSPVEDTGGTNTAPKDPPPAPDA